MALVQPYNQMKNTVGKIMNRRVSKETAQKVDSVEDGRLENHRKTLERHQKKVKDYLEKISAEVEMSKEFSRANNKRDAIHCLEKKLVYEQQIEYLMTCQRLIFYQMEKIKRRNFKVATIDALFTDTELKVMPKPIKIDDVDKTTYKMIEQADDLKLIEQSDDVKRIQDALSTPLGSSADFDMHKLEAELKQLDEVDLEEQLPAVRQPTHSIAKKRTAEELLASDGDDSVKRKRQNKDIM